MNNLEAYSLLKSHNDSISDATKNFLGLFQVPQTEFEHFRYRFRGIISEHRVFRKRGELENWNSQVFFYHQEVADDVEGAIITKSEKEVFIEEKILPSRKHILDITSESLTKRLSILLDHIHFIAKRESVDAKKIATLSLEILANREDDRKTTKVRKLYPLEPSHHPIVCWPSIRQQPSLISLKLGKGNTHN